MEGWRLRCVFTTLVSSQDASKNRCARVASDRELRHDKVGVSDARERSCDDCRAHARSTVFSVHTSFTSMLTRSARHSFQDAFMVQACVALLSCETNLIRAHPTMHKRFLCVSCCMSHVRVLCVMRSLALRELVIVKWLEPILIIWRTVVDHFSCGSADVVEGHGFDHHSDR